MKYIIKLWDKGDNRNNYVTDEVYANNETELRDIYKLMDKDIEIINKTENPILSQLSVKPTNTAISLEVNQSELKFSDGGIDFKIVNNEIFKKDWIILNGEYQITTKNNKKVNLSNYIVKVKDWVKVNKN